MLSYNEFINRFNNKESKMLLDYQAILRIAICMALYAITSGMQRSFEANGSIAGILAQLQVMISAYLVVTVKKIGYFIAISFNIIQCIIVGSVYFIVGNKSVLPGVIVPICTIVTLSIISFYGRQLRKKLAEETEQKDELYELYEELAARENEISQQNVLLLKYNQQMKENEDKLNRLAYIDVLTELPNRRKIVERLDFLTNLESDKQTSFAVVFIDLDDFKRINDSKGHNIGDCILKEVVTKISMQLHGKDILGRLGGDEFALIIQKSLREEEIYEYVERIRISLTEKIYVANEEYRISASFGVAVYPKDGTDTNELIKNADTAMYKSKAKGRNVIHFFHNKMNEELLHKIEFENRLRASIYNEELYLMFQPQYYTSTKRLRGFEALARWDSPELGMISPKQFIPIAEEMGYIIPLGIWVLRSACQTARFIMDRYPFEFIISVNVSALQFSDPSFVQTVEEILKEEKVPGRYIEFELTESVFITSRENIIDIMNNLKELGIRIAIDDFGTGYSSLSYLQRLPIDTLKIDKSFIDSIGDTMSSRHIVGNVIDLVHQMEISVVSEGVENENQLNYLNEKKCDSIQGYLWGKPMKEKDVLELINDLNSNNQLNEAKPA